VLVVDDEAAARSALTQLLEEEGYEVRSAGDAYKAIGRTDAWAPDLAITDLAMPGMDGVELMERLRASYPHLPVVVMTAHGSVESAVQALQKGADDYLTKPLNFEHILLVARRAVERRALMREAKQLRARLAAQRVPAQLEIVGKSRVLRDLLDLTRQVSSSDANVLISGERGTGREIVARALHGWSARANGPFVRVDCCEVTDVDTFDATFRARGGALDRAQGGTLFLREVLALADAEQARLCAILRTRAVEREGHEVAVDVRVVASSEGDFDAALATGQLREELYYALKVIELPVPTLRERIDDIPVLADHFLRKVNLEQRRGIDGIDDRALSVLKAYDWPGNVKQLRDIVLEAAGSCQSKQIGPRDFPREVLEHTPEVDKAPRVPGASLEEIERWAIVQTLRQTGGSTSRAAKLLGISPRKIQYRINEYKEQGIDILRRR